MRRVGSIPTPATSYEDKVDHIELVLALPEPMDVSCRHVILISCFYLVGHRSLKFQGTQREAIIRMDVNVRLSESGRVRLMSQLTVKLRWKVTAVLDDEPPYKQDNVIFNLSPKTGLYSQFSIPPQHRYVPKVLSPTVTYHQVLKNLLGKSSNIEIKEKKFPYRVFVPQIDSEVLLNLQIWLFPPNILSLTVKLSDVPTDNLDAIRLIDYQRLDYLRPISDIVQWTIGMAETMNHRNFNLSQPLRFKPAIHLDGICQPEEFRDHIENNLSKYVGVLIRNYDFELMDDRIPARLIEKNQEHNLKSLQELLLIDKQGILYLTPTKTNIATPKRPRFSRSYDLFGVALVFSDYVSQYQSLRFRNEDFADFILYIVRRWIDEPETVFSASVSNLHRWHLLIAEFGLKQRMRSTVTRSVEHAIEEKSSYFDQFADCWWKENDFPYLIARQIEESRDLQLGFLENEDLERLVIEDYGEARRSFQSKNYKATILLSGSIAEAILTAVVDKANLPGITTKKLYDDFNLFKLTKTARQHAMIKDECLFLYLDSLRKYRNMIHPGVQVRKSISPDSSRATIALETVNLLVKELNKTK